MQPQQKSVCFSPFGLCCVISYVFGVCVCVCVAESRCILLPVVLRVLQAHMQEQRDLVMCARIFTSMLSLIKKEENGTAVRSALVTGCHHTSQGYLAEMTFALEVAAAGIQLQQISMVSNIKPY